MSTPAKIGMVIDDHQRVLLSTHSVRSHFSYNVASSPIISEWHGHCSVSGLSNPANTRQGTFFARFFERFEPQQRGTSIRQMQASGVSLLARPLKPVFVHVPNGVFVAGGVLENRFCPRSDKETVFALAQQF